MDIDLEPIAIMLQLVRTRRLSCDNGLAGMDESGRRILRPGA
jgi:hypothetical protein